MKSILKITFKNLWAKKGRTLMILISVVLSGALIYASMNMSIITKDIFVKNYTKNYGTTTVLINKEDYTFIDEINLSSDINYTETSNLIGYTEFDSLYTVNMLSFTFDEFETIYTPTYINKLDTEFNSNHIIIGEKNSIKYGVDINDTVSVTINGINVELVVYAVVKEGDTFLDYSPTLIDCIISKSLLPDVLGDYHYNLYFINEIDPVLIDNLINDNPSLTVTDLYNQEEIITNTQNIVTPIVLTATCVIIVSMFIIYSTYKIIIIERMAFIGTLRSIGATKGKTNLALVIESVLLGIIGGILSILLGMLFLKLIFNLFFSNSDLMNISMNYFSIKYGLVTLLLSIIITVISSFFSIIKTNKMNIKEIIFNELKHEKLLSIKNIVLGTILVILSLVLVSISSHSSNLVYSLVGLLFIIIGSILLIPILIRIVIPVLNILLYLPFRNKTVISNKNIKNDKTLLNNIVLLSIGLGMILMINSFSASVANNVGMVYDDGVYDLVINDNSLDQDTIDIISSVDGVSNVYTVKNIDNVATTQGFDLIHLEGIDLVDYDTYAWNVFSDHIGSETITKFETTPSIILSSFIARKNDVEIGDILTIETDYGLKDIEVVGIIPLLLYNGNMTFINYDFFTEYFDTTGYQKTFIEVDGDITSIKNDIKASYPYSILSIVSLVEMRETNDESNEMIFSLMKAISLLAMFIGCIGIINNFLISFISRRQVIANLRSLGLSKTNTVKLLLVEALQIGIIGGLLSVLLGNVYFKFLSIVIEGLNITSELMSYSFKEMVFVFVSAIILSLIAAIIPAVRLSNNEIIESLKFE